MLGITIVILTNSYTNNVSGRLGLLIPLDVRFPVSIEITQKILSGSLSKQADSRPKSGKPIDDDNDSYREVTLNIYTSTKQTLWIHICSPSSGRPLYVFACHYFSDEP